MMSGLTLSLSLEAVGTFILCPISRALKKWRPSSDFWIEQASSVPVSFRLACLIFITGLWKLPNAASEQEACHRSGAIVV